MMAIHSPALRQKINAPSARTASNRFSRFSTCTEALILPAKFRRTHAPEQPQRSAPKKSHGDRQIIVAGKNARRVKSDAEKHAPIIARHHASQIQSSRRARRGAASARNRRRSAARTLESLIKPSPGCAPSPGRPSTRARRRCKNRSA